MMIPIKAVVVDFIKSNFVELTASTGDNQFRYICVSKYTMHPKFDAGRITYLTNANSAC